MNNKYAVLIGVGYFGTRVQLLGCIEDVIKMQSVLSKKLGYRRFRILSDSRKSAHHKHIKPTKRNIIKALDSVVTMSNKGYNEIFIHYSGHGTSVRDSLSRDERDRKDEAVVPLDYHRGLLLDDEIHQKLVKINKKCRLTMVFDCCHSGSIADLPYTTTGTGKTIRENSFKLSTKVVMYSGCMDVQKSFSIRNKRTGKWSGALTNSFTKWLSYYVDKKSSLGSLKLLSLMNKDMDKDGYPQDPQLATVKRPHKSDILIGTKGMLRTGKKSIPRRIKRKRVVKRRRQRRRQVKKSESPKRPKRRLRRRKRRRRKRRDLKLKVENDSR